MYLFKFPDVGEGIHEGTVVKVLVKEGQDVKADASIFEVETDKAVVELPSPKTGKVLKLYVKEGEKIKVGQTIIAIGEQGEKAPEKPDETVAEAKPVAKPSAPTPSAPSAPSGEGVLATPAIRALAKKLGVDIEKVKGSGPGGRIMPVDVEKAPKDGPSAAAPAAKEEFHFAGPVDRQALSSTRRAIANQMVKWSTIPQALVSEDFDLTKLYEYREKLKKDKPGQKYSYLAFFVKAIALTLKKHAGLNATFLGEEIAFKKYYNIGIATDTPAGLMVPVVKGADSKKISAITSEIESLATGARERKIKIEDLRDGTFTITNVGSLGGVATQPVINYPESGILALNKMRDMPVVIDGKVVVRKIMRVDLGFDHRVLDGADAVRFIIDLKDLLENPEKLSAEL